MKSVKTSGFTSGTRSPYRTKSGSCKDQASKPARPPFVPLSRSKRKVSRLHQAIQSAFPMHDLRALSSAKMEEYLRLALGASDVRAMKDNYLLASVFKRYQSVDTDNVEMRVSAALDKLMESEVKCAESNRVFAGGLDRSNARIPLEYLPLLARARKHVSRILGRFRLDELPKACNFTPGATTEFTRKSGQLHNKWSKATHCTSRAQPYVEAFMRWSKIPDLQRDVIINERNTVFTVPKNFDRDRTACKPVTWNGFLQLGLGTMLRRRLRKEGLLQPDAQEYHGVLAKVASSVPGLVTRDLASASDCVSLGLLEALLPTDWFDVIMDLREPYGVLPDGSTVCWEKVSSMGNGFTFELETLVFYALVKACCSRESLVSVYGDDIIFPAPHADKVDDVLSFCGFEINLSKSFGPPSLFRESCGGHYFSGNNVKPFYITRLPATIGQIINLHNDVVRWVGDRPRPDHFLFDIWRLCREIVPREYWGPAPHQGVLWAEWDEARPNYHPDYQAWEVGCISFVPRSDDLGEEETVTCYRGENYEPYEVYVNRTPEELLGAYLQKLWCCDPLPWESTETSIYRSMTDKEVRVWSYFDRAQWTRLTAETLCT